MLVPYAILLYHYLSQCFRRQEKMLARKKYRQVDEPSDGQRPRKACGKRARAKERQRAAEAADAAKKAARSTTTTRVPKASSSPW
jgi:hypothetical protein